MLTARVFDRTSDVSFVLRRFNDTLAENCPHCAKILEILHLQVAAQLKFICAKIYAVFKPQYRSASNFSSPFTTLYQAYR